MILNYKHHWYEGVTDEVIELPDDTIFIYKDGDVGDLCYKGFNHYLAATKSEIELENDLSYSVCAEFPGITFIQFDNCIFDKIPLVSGEEFYNRLQLGNYFVFRSTKGEYEVNWKEVDGRTTLHSTEIASPKPISITKILSIEGPYRISVFTVQIRSWSGDEDLYSIANSNFVDLSSLTIDTSLEVRIKRNCAKEFSEYINKVLSLVNYKVTTAISGWEKSNHCLT